MPTPPISRYVTPEQYLKYEQARDVVALLNPTVIVEILSDFSEERDRGEKWLAYKEIESLNTYVLIHQDRPLVEVFHREVDGGTWEINEVEGLDATISLPAIGIEVPTAELYCDIEF